MQRYSLIENYLEKALPKNLSAKQKQKLRDEIEGHILDKVDFYVEIGYDELTSVKKAVEEMGEAEPVCEEFDRIYKTKPHIFFILTVVFLTASISFYFLVAAQLIGDMEFYPMFALLLSAEISLLMTLIFAVSTVVSYLRVTFEKKLRKITASVLGSIFVFSALFAVWGYIDLYQWYSPMEYAEKPSEYLQSHFPYHNITDDKNEYADIEVSHVPGTDLIEISATGSFKADCSIDYEAKYFETHSLFLNRKFSFEMCYAEQFFHHNNMYIPEDEKREFNDIIYTPYIADDFYGIMISDAFHTYLISISDVAEYNITFDDFVKTAIKQYKNVRTAVKEKVFLDVPIWENLEYFFDNF